MCQSRLQATPTSESGHGGNPGRQTSDPYTIGGNEPPPPGASEVQGPKIIVEDQKVHLYSWTCPVCKKKLKHFYRESLEWNIRCHLETHSKDPNGLARLEKKAQLNNVLLLIGKLRKDLNRRSGR